jgi:hypothetical protein
MSSVRTQCLQNLSEGWTPRTERILREFGLATDPKDGGQEDRKSLAGQVTSYGPGWRSRRMIRDERYPADERKSNWPENPAWVVCANNLRQ